MSDGGCAPSRRGRFGIDVPAGGEGVAAIQGARQGRVGVKIGRHNYFYRRRLTYPNPFP